MATATEVPARRGWRTRLRRIVAAFLIASLGIVLAFRVSPRPGAKVIRWAFDKGGVASNDTLASYVPAGVEGLQQVSYGNDGDDTTLDAWFPTSLAESQRTLPTVVWVHGGGWVSGDKSQVANYLKIIAAHGYTVIGINYSLAPGAKSPTPLRQTNEALAYILAHAPRLHVDTDRMVLAGDSAGAHIAAQVAAVTTNAPYASGLGITPSLRPSELVGTVLNCGPYVPSMVQDSRGLEGWFVKTVAWAYLGTKDFESSTMQHVDLVRHTTASFPPTWISGGNNDPLTEQGRAFSAHLAGLGVDVTSLFFADDHRPALGHEYQFDLSLAASQRALDQTLTFLDAVTRAAS